MLPYPATCRGGATASRYIYPPRYTRLEVYTPPPAYPVYTPPPAYSAAVHPPRGIYTRLGIPASKYIYPPRHTRLEVYIPASVHPPRGIYTRLDIPASRYIHPPRCTRLEVYIPVSRGMVPRLASRGTVRRCTRLEVCIHPPRHTRLACLEGRGRVQSTAVAGYSAAYAAVAGYSRGVQCGVCTRLEVCTPASRYRYTQPWPCMYPCGGLYYTRAAVYGRAVRRSTAVAGYAAAVCGRGRVQCGFIRAAMPAAYVRRYARPRAGALSGTEPRGSALASSRCMDDSNPSRKVAARQTASVSSASRVPYHWRCRGSALASSRCAGCHTGRARGIYGLPYRATYLACSRCAGCHTGHVRAPLSVRAA
jgi:hypothetical protein